MIFSIDSNKKLFEQKIYWTERAQKNCMLFGDKNAKYLRSIAPLTKRQNYISKINDEYGNWFENQNLILKVNIQEIKRM